jgi:hypothetical protein
MIAYNEETEIIPFCNMEANSLQASVDCTKEFKLQTLPHDVQNRSPEILSLLKKRFSEIYQK